MPLHLAFAVKVFAALFAFMNPIAKIPIFLGLTDGASWEVQKRVAVTAILGTTVGCLIAVAAGEPILAFFGIGVDDFKLAGGLLILMIALPMVNGASNHAHNGTPEERAHHETLDPGDVAIYPLTIPILVGPGTIATLIVFGTQARVQGEYLALAAGMIAFLLVLAAALLAAPVIGRYLSPTATSITRRLMGMILAAIAAEMIVQALRDLFPGLAH